MIAPKASSPVTIAAPIKKPRLLEELLPEEAGTGEGVGEVCPPKFLVVGLKLGLGDGELVLPRLKLPMPLLLVEI